MFSEMAPKMWMVFGLFAVAVGEKRVMDDYRVPGAIEPTHYTLKLLTNLEDDFSFLGEVSYDFFMLFDSRYAPYSQYLIEENLWSGLEMYLAVMALFYFISR